MTYIAVEGLIGSGKSTLSRWLADRLEWQVLPEPVETNPVLDLFYADQKRWSFPMQIWLLHHRYRHQQVAGHSHVPCIVDRSLPGDRVFAKLMTKYGNMTDKEWSIYETCYASMSMVRPPFLLIYLEVDPEVAMERIHRRARSVETGITLKYLKDLDDEYDQLIKDIEGGSHYWSRGIEVRRLPWNADHRDLANSPAIDLVTELKRYVERP